MACRPLRPSLSCARIVDLLLGRDFLRGVGLYDYCWVAFSFVFERCLRHFLRVWVQLQSVEQARRDLVSIRASVLQFVDEFGPQRVLIACGLCSGNEFTA